MTTYRHTKGMGEISGFGGGYEECCQDMLEAGIKWLLEHPDAEPQFHGYEGVYGIISEDNEDAKTLTKIVVNASEKKGGATGAMHQAVISRLCTIKKHGWEWYCTELRQHHNQEKSL